MKLIEIFEPSVEQKNYRGEFDFRSSGKNMGHGVLGQGSFSVARHDKSDPHMVNKRQYDPGTEIGTVNDVFDLYATVVVKEQLWDMVHFPRIYKIKKITDSTGKSVHRWKMEKLIPLDSVSVEELQHLFRRYFATMPNSTSPHYISRHIKEVIQYGWVRSIKDDTFKAACEKLIEIFTEIQKTNDAVFIDLHSNNLMVRRSHLGIDVVFSDPFAARVQ